ncbi:uncharacterized protein LOC141946923 [Strix uralensis]|uniref:uncharacterized protein LOC141946923 n=1 Tax=Strix uralensis TaxID=36305 RepID=UPI003DA4EE77
MGVLVLDMAGQRRGMSLPLLLSFAVLDVMLGTTATDVTVTMSPTFPTSSTPRKTTALLPTTAAPLPPSSPETSTPEVLSDAFTVSAATPRGSSPAASSIPAPQARGSAAHSTPGLPVDTMVQPDPPPKVLGLTSGIPDPALMATTPNCEETTIITSVGTSTALAVSSFGVETSMLPPPTSTLLPSTWVGTTLGTSTHQGPAMTMPLGSTSPGTGSASSPTAPAPTAASDEPLTTSDTMATPVTSTGIPGSTPIPSQLAGTTPDTSTLTAPETPGATTGTTTTDVTATVSSTFPTSLTSVETSTLLPTTNSTSTGTLPPSSPEMGASTLERSSTSSGISSASPPSAPAPTAASAEPLTTLADTTDTPVISTGVPGSNPAPSQSSRTTSRITPGISTMTMGLTPSTPTISGTVSTPADLPTTLPVCPTSTSNTSASYLFLSLRLTVPLDLGNTTVQELLLSQLRRYLQTAFPCAGLAVGWRGHRRT